MINKTLAGSVCTLSIARPEKLNALDVDVLRALGAAVEQLHGDHSVRCVVVTGEGKAFVAGADIASMKSLDRGVAQEFSALGHRVFDAIEGLPMPVIAAVNGFALGGGCELALACDFIHASEKAKFGQPEVKLGVIPGFGGTQRLSRRVGVARARELVYSGAMIDAQQALSWGLVNAVWPADQLLSKVGELASSIAQMGPLAVQAAKRVIREGEGMPLRAAAKFEIEAFADCFATDDQREGMAAFLEKRAAVFTGR